MSPSNTTEAASHGAVGNKASVLPLSCAVRPGGEGMVDVEALQHHCCEVKMVVVGGAGAAPLKAGRGV